MQAGTYHWNTAEAAQKLEVSGLLLVKPLTSVKDMLAAVNPQMWLP